MTQPLSFVMIGRDVPMTACAEQLLARGHRLLALISDCPHGADWAARHGIRRIGEDEDPVVALQGLAFDHLLSIINHRIVPPALLARARRGGINFHDSPLPAYAGFNATSWALLDGRTQHAISWHEMTGDVDGGRLLLQQPIAISDDDTAYTLAVKCSDAAVGSFAALLDRIETANATGQPQQGARSFHRRSERPGIGALDLSRPAAALCAQVRALNQGPQDNWMCMPKLRLQDGWIVAREAQVAAAVPAAAGTVLALGSDGIDLATGRGVLRLHELFSVDGEALDASRLAQDYGVAIGQQLPVSVDLDALDAFDRTVTGDERFWVQRLASLHAPTLAEFGAASGPAQPAWLLRRWPAGLVGQPAAARRGALTAALAAYLARVDDSPSFDLAATNDLPATATALYAQRVPLRCAVDRQAAFAQLHADVDAELGRLAQRRTHARDVRLRYAALRRQPERPVLPIGVHWLEQLPDTASCAVLDGQSLVLQVTDVGPEYAWLYDRSRLNDAAAVLLADRIDRLLQTALAAPETPIADLPLLTEPERRHLLDSGQGPRRDPRPACIHSLFEQQAQHTPDATAVVFREASLSYRALDQRAERLAAQLRREGVRPGQRVGLCVQRSLDLVIGLLGILKAGGAYVPLDPAYPRERLAMMLEDAAAPVLVTQTGLREHLPAHAGRVLLIGDTLGTAACGLPDDVSPPAAAEATPAATPDDLAYVIFTSGSTGRPKGVMVRHRNVANFFAGMDEVIGVGSSPGVWLAITSISFDISVLELLWTLTRGFRVVIQTEADSASLARAASHRGASATPMDFGLFYFSADAGSAPQGHAYRLLLEGARYADTHGFASVWTPERHFHPFGGLYPNPAVTTAALATITQRVHLRAGSVVLPLHDPLRVAEDWSVIDNLSGGRVGLSFASGWHVNDFAFKPENYERRREVMNESIDTVLKLWRGDKVAVRNGEGRAIEVAVLPRPLQTRPPMWLASAGSIDTFRLAGRMGMNVLTNMLGQDLADLKIKFAAYREARREHGHAGDGVVSVMLHTFVCDDTERARALARQPFCNYLASSFDLVKVAPWMFPAFKRPSLEAAQAPGFDASRFTSEDMAALLDHAFERYFDTAGLFGAPERALEMVEQLKAIGANEVACLIDFGIEADTVLASLPHLDRLRRLANPTPDTSASTAAATDASIAEQLLRHGVTHLQCTPSVARLLASDPQAAAGLRGLRQLLLGGEALPPDLVTQLAPLVGGEIVNLYGPTETTVWSTCARVDRTAGPVTIGRPIVNTTVRIVDARQRLLPVGTPGELCIGGAGVVAGYLGREDLTAERFVPDPYVEDEWLYRTGDLARWCADGQIEFLGRLDHQVKVNGYRIELGEVEAALARHPAVKQCVVAARAEQGSSQLVGYLVLAGRAAADGAAADAQRIAQWERLWDQAYRQAADDRQVAEPRFNTAGWTDSRSGEPIPRAEMRAWLDATLQRLRTLRPRRVLEIGCGTGMILYGLLPTVEHYTAVDLSPQALEDIRGELTEAERARVTLLLQPAHRLEGIAERSVDLIVINSVAQYFPDADYLRRVLQRACACVADGGQVFVGDLRSFVHLDAFHTLVELHQAAAELPAVALSERIARRVRQEGELLVDADGFESLRRELPRIGRVELQLKRGIERNEMNLFRYDVVLHIGLAEPGKLTPQVRHLRGPDDLDTIRAQLASEPEQLLLTDVLNARLPGLANVATALASDGSATVGSLRGVLEHAAAGIDPERLYTLDGRYTVQTRWARSGDRWRFDALLSHRERAGDADWPADSAGVVRPITAAANQPARVDDREALFEDLRAALRERLPAYMLPSSFVVLDALPLTPNGKIDRQALPAPTRGPQRTAAAVYSAPAGELEGRIATLWQQLLQVERVGRQDNIFDLGANSLLVAEASSRLSALLDRKVPLVSLFRFPSVQALAAHLSDDGQAPAQAAAQAQARDDRRKDAAARRRQLRAERSPN